MILPEKLRRLDVRIGGQPDGELWQQAQLLFKYLRDDPVQAAVGLLMPPTRLLYQSNSLFPVMDQNLPEGFEALAPSRQRRLFVGASRQASCARQGV